MSEPPPDLKGILARAIQHIEMALSIADVQATNITLEPAIVRAVTNAAKQLYPMCDVADAADAVHTRWAGLLSYGPDRLTTHNVVEAMQALMIVLGKKLWDALPPEQKKAYQGMAAAMDPQGNVLEDFDGNPITLDADALDRLDKVVVNPLADLVDKAERLHDLMVNGDETDAHGMILREIEPESIVPALRELRAAVDRMLPWKSRKPQ